MLGVPRQGRRESPIAEAIGATGRRIGASQRGPATQPILRQTLLADSEEPERDPGRLVVDRLCRLGGERPSEPDPVVELAKRPLGGGPGGMGARDRLASPLDDGQIARLLDPGQQLREA